MATEPNSCPHQNHGALQASCQIRRAGFGDRCRMKMRRTAQGIRHTVLNLEPLSNFVSRFQTIQKLPFSAILASLRENVFAFVSSFCSMLYAPRSPSPAKLKTAEKVRDANLNRKDCNLSSRGRNFRTSPAFFASNNNPKVPVNRRSSVSANSLAGASSKLQIKSNKPGLPRQLLFG